MDGELNQSLIHLVLFKENNTSSLKLCPCKSPRQPGTGLKIWSRGQNPKINSKYWGLSNLRVYLAL